MTRATGPDRAEDIADARAHLLTGCAVVATAALAGIWAPPNFVMIVALLALMRVCWLEDNITNDLIGRDRLPGGYVNTAIRRGNWMRMWLGREPAEDASRLPPHQLATAMRAEVQVWGCMLFGMAATLVARAEGFGPMLHLLAGGALLALALLRVDRLTVSLAHCAAGRALPRRLLLPTHRRVTGDGE
jgi:hypothetical protein